MSAALHKSVLSWLDESQDRFALWTPINLDLTKGGEDGDVRLPIDGIASTEAEDADGETLIQKGIDWTDALSRYGGLTLEHPAGAFNVIGDIESTYETTVDGHAATGIRGAIWKADKLGARVAEKLEGMKKSKARTQWGLSVEGRAVRRRAGRPKVIELSKIATVAVTSRPKNRLCTVDPIAASLFGLSGLTPRADIVPGGMPGIPMLDLAEFRRWQPLLKGLRPIDVAVLKVGAANPFTTFAEARAAVERHWSAA